MCRDALFEAVSPVEHNINSSGAAQPSQPPRRPDLSTFFSTLDLVDTSGSRQPQNANALPLPRDISAAFRNLANAFEMLRGGDGDAAGGSHDELLDTLVQSLMQDADHPPTEVEGVSDEFIEQLERVPKKVLKSDMSCPICANPFLDGVTPLHSTLIKKREPPPKPADDDEEEFDDIEVAATWRGEPGEPCRWASRDLDAIALVPVRASRRGQMDHVIWRREDLETRTLSSSSGWGTVRLRGSVGH
nr:hypothetical protein CFP56_13253 [Quercus suber]